ncbi:hypothetical protein BFJ70_g16615 [Fusarium oxysporum]|nr:hypothetical protein BFJ70_g16615 [Fusarium oxysporum]
MITTVLKSHLEAIPNLEKWVEENSRPGEANEAEVIYVQTDIADDFISVASTPKLPSLPRSSEWMGYERRRIIILMKKKVM